MVHWAADADTGKAQEGAAGAVAEKLVYRRGDAGASCERHWEHCHVALTQVRRRMVDAPEAGVERDDAESGDDEEDDAERNGGEVEEEGGAMIDTTAEAEVQNELGECPPEEHH